MKWYYSLMENAKNRKFEEPTYTEKHHITPKSLSGSNSKENLVRLTVKEHIIAHLLLIKMVEGDMRRRMGFAYIMMMRGTFGRNKTENARELCAPWQTLSGTCETSDIESQQGTKSWYQTERRNKTKNFTCVDGSHEISRLDKQGKSQSGENSQDCGKASWDEAFKRSSTENEYGQKRKICSLEQRIKEAETIEVLTAEGYRSFSGISRAYKPTIKIITNTTSLVCTKDHGIQTADGEWKPAKELKMGDLLYMGQIVESIDEHIDTYVYDLLSVEHTYSFIANDILVSNCIMLDEFAFVATHVADEFIKSVIPTVSSGQDTKIIISSTPKGLNTFYKVWEDAVKIPVIERNRDDFVPIAVEWNQVPGRNEAFRAGIIKKYGQAFWDQEFACCVGNTIVTIRNKITGLIEDITIGELYLRCM
jgi:hypothetical protein